MISRNILSVLFAGYAMLASLVSCSAGDAHVAATDPRIAWSGRTRVEGSSVTVFWSGSSVRLNIEGESLEVNISDEKGQNYFYAIVDGRVLPKFHPEAGTKDYTIVSGLRNGRHAVELFKLTEERHGYTRFNHFSVLAGKSAGKVADKSPDRKRRIEFYGNSITSGYSLEDTAGDSNKPEYFNNYKSYAAITARHFDADYWCISKSGIGITVSWFPIIMPEMYDRLDPSDPTSKWDFSRYTPDVVIVNLLANDLDLINMPKDENFIARFGDKKPSDAYIVNAYKTFIMSLRQKYPGAWIVCTLDAWKDPESDGHRFPGIINKAIDQLNDPRIKSHFFDYPRQHKKGHPKEKDHQAMATSLIQFLEMNVEW